jgi:transcriptional regulator with XRE-family HTH domain
MRFRPTAFGRRLRERRLAELLNQRFLAEDAGVPIGTIRNHEQGRSRTARHRTVMALVACLGPELLRPSRQRPATGS